SLRSFLEIPAAIGSGAEPLGIGHIEDAPVAAQGHTRGKPRGGDIADYGPRCGIEYGDRIYSGASNVQTGFVRAQGEAEGQDPAQATHALGGFQPNGGNEAVLLGI